MKSSRKTSEGKYKWDPSFRPIYHWLKGRRCAQCWGQVYDQEKEEGGGWEIYCPNECEPGGHVSAEYVETQLLLDSYEAEQVANAYPDLAEASGQGDLVHKQKDLDNKNSLY